MAQIASGNDKYSLGYTATNSNESTSRLLSGLNSGTGSSSGNAPGPVANTAITNLINTLRSFTNGSMGNWRWIYERAVTE